MFTNFGDGNLFPFRPSGDPFVGDGHAEHSSGMSYNHTMAMTGRSAGRDAPDDLPKAPVRPRLEVARPISIFSAGLIVRTCLRLCRGSKHVI
jgi:hypothetical protein